MHIRSLGLVISINLLVLVPILTSAEQTESKTTQLVLSPYIARAEIARDSKLIERTELQRIGGIITFRQYDGIGNLILERVAEDIESASFVYAETAYFKQQTIETAWKSLRLELTAPIPNMKIIMQNLADVLEAKDEQLEMLGKETALAEVGK